MSLQTGVLANRLVCFERIRKRVRQRRILFRPSPPSSCERRLINEAKRVADRLAELRSEGIRAAIDDMGTGHCSLTSLPTFPLDPLKIDKVLLTPLSQLMERRRCWIPLFCWQISWRYRR